MNRTDENCEGCGGGQIDKNIVGQKWKNMIIVLFSSFSPRLDERRRIAHEQENSAYKTTTTTKKPFVLSRGLRLIFILLK